MSDADFLVRLRLANQAITDLLRGLDWSLFDICECGHRRIEHGEGKLHQGHEPCRRKGCACWDFGEDVGRGNPLRVAERRRVA